MLYSKYFMEIKNLFDLRAYRYSLQLLQIEKDPQSMFNKTMVEMENEEFRDIWVVMVYKDIIVEIEARISECGCGGSGGGGGLDSIATNPHNPI